ncbi:MAG TPA: cupin domain-containing protein [Longimicrobiaceae bacterium]|nr:cupin domain-containing protein [Longimicrobiaceae bacterium]
MSSLNRPLAGQPLHFHLGGGRSALVDAALLEKSGRSARTLVKEGPMRVTLIALAAGGNLAPHHAEGPITVHVLDGAIRFLAGDDSWELSAGDVLSLPAGVQHAVESESGGEFLVTIAREG